MTIPDWLRLRTAPGGARQPTGEVFLPLTAQQALEARREALALAEDEGALALCANACLVARGVEGEAALGEGCWRLAAGGDRDPGPAVGGLEPEGGPGARLGARAAGGPEGPAGRLALAAAAVAGAWASPGPCPRSGQGHDRERTICGARPTS